MSTEQMLVDLRASINSLDERVQSLREWVHAADAEGVSDSEFVRRLLEKRLRP